jgi:hypothetical protein
MSVGGYTDNKIISQDQKLWLVRRQMEITDEYTQRSDFISLFFFQKKSNGLKGEITSTRMYEFTQMKIDMGYATIRITGA